MTEIQDCNVATGTKTPVDSHVEMPEFRDVTTNDWFTLKDRFSEFRIQRKDRFSQGYEEFFTVQPGWYIRVYECTESLALHDRIRVPRGLIQVLFNLRGMTELQIEGHATRTMASPAMYVCNFSANQLLVDSPVLHDQDRKFINLIIDPKEFQLNSITVDHSFLSKTFLSMLSGDEDFFFQSFPMDGGLLASLNQILTQQFDVPVKKIFMRAKAFELLCNVMDVLAKHDVKAAGSGVNSSEYYRIVEVQRYISQQVTSPPTLEELTTKFSMSASKLKRLFKAIHGVAIGEYSKSLRMYEARNMLQNSDRSISQVANELGYEHSSSFITAFKRNFGVTPLSFRSLLSRED